MIDDRIKKTMSAILGVPVVEINNESSPTSIDKWDSLRHMNLIIGLEEEFGVCFSDTSIPEMVSYKLIKNEIQRILSQ
ncbi:MAG: acyl carrier protein [Desulfobacter sp.]